MEMDELREKWADYDRKLDLCIRLNQQLIGQTYLNRARSALQRLIAGMAVEASINFLALLALGSFLYRYWNEVPFMVPGLALHLWGIALFGMGIRQIVLAAQVDYGQQVAAIQRQLEALRAERLWQTRFVLLTAPLTWTPLLIVLLKGGLGLNAYQIFGMNWILANLAFGVLWIPAILWAAQTFVSRAENSPLLRRILRAVSDQGLNEIEDFLTSLAAFESDGVEEVPRT